VGVVDVRKIVTGVHLLLWLVLGHITAVIATC